MKPAKLLLCSCHSANNPLIVTDNARLAFHSNALVTGNRIFASMPVCHYVVSVDIKAHYVLSIPNLDN